jgi:signal transduction histidine kinase
LKQGFALAANGGHQRSAVFFEEPVMDSPIEQQNSALAAATKELDQLRRLNDKARDKLAALALEDTTRMVTLDSSGGQILRKLDEVLALPSHNLHGSLTSLLLSVERLIDLDARDVPGVNEVIERQILHLSSLVNDLIDLTQDTLDPLDGDQPASDTKPTLPWP